MIVISKFVGDHIPVFARTLGLAVLSYLGYHSVRWIINTCQRTKKIDQVAKKNISDQPSTHPFKPFVNQNFPKTYVELKTKLMANRKELIVKFPLRFLKNQKELTEDGCLSNLELYGYAFLICIEHAELYAEHYARNEWDEFAFSNPELQNNFLKSDCRYLFDFVKVCDNHWTLLLVDKQQQTVEYYDSKHNYGEENYKQIINKSKKIARNFGYKFEEKILKSIQDDGYQCGIWVLYFLEERVKNPNASFNDLPNPSKLIANFRKHVSNCLLIIDQLLKNI